MKASSQVKSKEHKSKFGEVFTAEREVKAMCDLVSEEMYSDITKTFLEPACGEGVFLIEVLKRKFAYCKNERDGLKALNSLYGIDIQKDNVLITRQNLVNLFKEHFPKSNSFAELFAWSIVSNNIICDDMLNPQTESVKSWGITPDKEYVKFLERQKARKAL